MLTQALRIHSRNKETTRIAFYTLALIAIFFVYLFLRGFAWNNTVLFEDTDSLSYLNNIEIFLSFDLQKIIDLDPDSTPFYPFFGALFSLPGWSVETGARLTSLFFSSLLFVAIAGIGKRIANPLEITLGLLMLTFSPVLISFSFGVLTEPSYMTTVYLGFWLFWTQYKKPKLWKAALMGVIFGLAFLNRVEGILYLGVIPLLQGVYILLEGRNNYSFKQLAGWISIYIVCFSLLAVPQVWRVSYKMGTLAVNGRQVWSVVFNSPNGRSQVEKLFSLDFSPSQNNIEYLKDHPELLDRFAETKPGPIRYLRLAVKNFNNFHQEKVGVLIGPIGLIFFGFGALALFQSGRRFELFLIIAFIGINLVGPFLHTVYMRHLLTIAPIMFLTAGIGMVYLSHRLLEGYKAYPFGGLYILPFIFLLGLFSAWVFPLQNTLKPPHANREYSPAELKAPVAIVKQIAEEELLRTPVIAAQRGYLAHFAEGKQLYLPYTDYDGLVKYLELNNVDFLYLKHSRVKKFPFFPEFLNDNPPDQFTLLYRSADAKNEAIELYRFKK